MCVHCEIEPQALAQEGFSGLSAVDRIVRAWEFANLDPFRAATHNKGVMNGIDPVVIATGNDWRAVEAGCHAYAALSGGYKPLTRWTKTEHGFLRGEIAVPVAVGTVGGVTKLHPAAKASLKLMGMPSSARLSAIIASVGLAQNLSALRALACEGIQKGHMGLHQRNLQLMKSFSSNQ
jgi:hydroxymethylglutaryl-CoA reductase